MVKTIEDVRPKHVLARHVRLGHRQNFMLIQHILRNYYQKQGLIQTIAETHPKIIKKLHHGASPPIQIQNGNFAIPYP